MPGDLDATAARLYTGFLRRTHLCLPVDLADIVVEELEAALGVDRLGGGDRRAYHTVGGLVLAGLGRVPQPGDRFEHAEHGFEVVAMEGRRIGQVRVAPLRATRLGQR